MAFLPVTLLFDLRLGYRQPLQFFADVELYN